MKNNNLSIEDIEKMIKNKENNVVYFVDEQDPFLFAGIPIEVSGKYGDREVKIQPCVGYNIEHGCRGSGMFNENFFIVDVEYSKIEKITADFNLHRWQSNRLVANKCKGRKPDTFLEYLQAARELNV